RQALALGGHVRMGEKARPSSMPTLLRSGWRRPPVRVWQATGADTVSARELRPRDQRVRVALGGDLPGALMQLRRMLKPDGLLSRLAHACGVMEPHPARAAKKRSIATIIWGDRRFESCSSSGESL